MKIFKKGDKVEIIGNVPITLKNSKNPLIGTIINIDGSYIYVRPKYNIDSYEFYPNELKHYIDIKKERKLKLKKINNDSKNL